MFPSIEKLLPNIFKEGIFKNETICNKDAITAEIINIFSVSFLSLSLN